MKKRLICLLLPITLTLLLFGCGEAASDLPVETEVLGLTGVPVFRVSSENEHDGVWDQIISNTDNGENHSPQLSWDPVENASCYVIYMSDTNMQDWIHWKSEHVTETSLPEGWADDSAYIGPYPPKGGTHHYEIYVIALQTDVDRAKGGLNSVNPKFAQNVRSLDQAPDGSEGNILAIGHLDATYTNE
ncbi:MAG: hypothetical protein J5518_06570 [Lachnospiraceae bacterium]|nr:hypothetical protein [Lachnospiraceae bacterium]